VITSLFLISGLFLRQRRTTDLRALGGVYQKQPLVACLAMVPLFSLAGVPPLSGFIAKLAVIGAVLDSGRYWLAAVTLVVSLLTVVSMARLWDESFWKPAPANPAQAPLGAAILTPIALLVALTLGLTAAAGPVYALSLRAAEQLLDPRVYVRSVLGEEATGVAR
jgi:multicomponent Na+:H+ antiporter subunit D